TRVASSDARPYGRPSGAENVGQTTREGRLGNAMRIGWRPGTEGISETSKPPAGPVHDLVRARALVADALARARRRQRHLDLLELGGRALEQRRPLEQEVAARGPARIGAPIGVRLVVRLDDLVRHARGDHRPPFPAERFGARSRA